MFLPSPLSQQSMFYGAPPFYQVGWEGLLFSVSELVINKVNMVWNDPVSKILSVFMNVWCYSEWTEKSVQLLSIMLKVSC